VVVAVGEHVLVDVDDDKLGVRLTWIDSFSYWFVWWFVSISMNSSVFSDEEFSLEWYVRKSGRVAGFSKSVPRPVEFVAEDKSKLRRLNLITQSVESYIVTIIIAREKKILNDLLDQTLR